MFQKIKSKLTTLLYFFLIILLALCVFLIVRELATQENGFTQGQKLPVENEKIEPAFNLSDNIEITQKDCANNCQPFNHNPVDLEFCQKSCRDKGFLIK
jgi:hypothetical protein